MRPYQQAAKEAIHTEWETGHQHTLLVLPTGCGKTIVFAAVVEDQVRAGDRVLILAHRGELLDQAADKILRSTGLMSATEKAESNDATAGPVTLEEALQRQQAKELRKALSLNDRFRFRRELFGNSDIRMNETLVLIDAMNSYEEAEDYILNDLNWDIENPEVAEFMKIVQKHFL